MESIISKVSPFIENGIQYVAFEVGGFNESIIFTGSSVCEKLEIEITEVEIITGSRIIPILDLVSGPADHRLKGYQIQRSSDYRTMLTQNFQSLRFFNRVRKVTGWVGKKNGKKYTTIETVNRSHFFVNSQHLMSLLKLDSQFFYILIGEFVSPDFYHRGEILQGYDEPVFTDNLLLKNLNLRITDTFENMKIKKSWKSTIENI